MKLYESYKRWPQYANVLEELIQHHECQVANKLSCKRTKRRESLQTTLFNETISSDGSSTNYVYTKRPKKQVRERKIEREVGGIVLRAAACKDKITSHCLHHDPSRIKLSTITAAHRAYHAMSRNEQKEWLWTIIGQNDYHDGYLIDYSDDDHNTHNFRVCNSCFADFHGFCRSTLQRRVRQYRAGHRRSLPAVAEPDHTHKRMVCREWIKDKSLTYGDYMPDALALVMPVYTKKEFYDWYKIDCQGESLSYPRVAAIIKSDFPFIRFRKHKKFTQCRLCNLIDMKITKTTVIFLSIHIAYICIILL